MKNTFISVAILSLLFISCKEDFNPLGEYSERYSLNCVIKVDTSFQVATVTQSYLGQTTDPFENTQDPFVDFVYIRMWYKGEVYIFNDSSITRTDKSRYNTDIKFYYINNLNPQPGNDLEIEALLPNGRRLKSVTRIPARASKKYGSFENKIPPEIGDIMHLQWTSDETNLVYHPRLYIIYNKTENGVQYRKSVPVPLEYYKKGGEEIPIYPNPSATPYVNIKMETINKLMKSISDGDEEKRHYEFMYCILEVITYDKNLSLYNSSSNTVLDDYSIKLDETDYTNITGGFGVFGSLVKSTFIIKFNTPYLESFGYRNGFE